MDLNCNEIIEKLETGEIKIHQIEKYAENANQATDIRRKFIENKTNTTLEHIGKYSIEKLS